MLVKNKQSGEIEGLRYGQAMEAVEAGTHEVVNELADPAEPPQGPEAQDRVSTPTQVVALDLSDPAQRGIPVSVEEVQAASAEVSETMTKAELEAEAQRRGVAVPSGATKAEIVALLNG